MRYTAKNVARICSKIVPEATNEYITKNTGINLPRLIDIAIVKLWTDQILLTQEEEEILRKIAKEMDSPGYATFEVE